MYEFLHMLNRLTHYHLLYRGFACDTMIPCEQPKLAIFEVKNEGICMQNGPSELSDHLVYIKKFNIIG